MQAIILAGGKGTRLRALTGDIFPKPLIDVHNKPLIDHIIEHTVANGCNNIIICTGYLGHKIEEHIDKNYYKAAIKISREKNPLGTAGALHLIKDLLEDEFFILYADIYTTINLKKMLEYHKKKKADVTIAVHVSDHPEDSTVVKLDHNGKFEAMIDKPGNDWMKYGNLTQTSLYIVKKDILNFIPQEQILDLAKDIFPAMLKKNKKIFGYPTEEYAKDMGTPERYNKVLKLLQT
ncbi:NDP-sugar synthase [Candidatus Roizmanbacteria bacterium]|nr:NDP-sugar synthase [Candidatus Roizmanbacteria bacterium]